MGKFFSLLLVPLSTALSACGSLAVYSTPPEAEVYLNLPGKGEPKLLGKTPYQTNIGELENAVNSGPISISVTKQGYMPQNFVIPNLGSGKLDIKATLLPNLPTNFKEVNRIVSLAFKAERLLMEKQYDKALQVSDEIKQINDNVSTAYQIEATVYFLKNELEKSRFAWIRAIELEPNQPEAHRMLNLIEKRLGITNPASPAAGE